MKTLPTIALYLALLVGFWPHRAAAQSVVGRWKRISSVTVQADGSEKDIDKISRKAVPCMADIVYTFVPGGTMTIDASKCPSNVRSMIESINARSRWSQAGNKITASFTDNTIPPSVHTVTFSGNTMTWRFNYADNPKMPNPARAKSMTIVYQRI